jgi:acyl carrier protein
MKQTLISEATVLDVVKRAVAATLTIDLERIEANSSLMKDLGAESLDFLDLNYRLERAFGIKMARHLMVEHIEDLFGEGAALDENSKLTEQAVALLKVRLGDNVPGLYSGMDMDEVPQVLTVESYVGGVRDILDTLPDTCPSCRSSAWKVSDQVRITCGSCGGQATFVNGDDLVREWLTRTQNETKIF